jgi:subtilisin family serine protease
MKHLFYTTLLLTFIGGLSAQTNGQWQDKVSPALLEDARAGQTVPFMILMTQQADVSQAKWLGSKEAKGEYVFQTLLETARESQQRILHFLKNKGASVQSLFVMNALKTQGNLSLIHEIALRDDVSRVVANPVISFAPPEEWSPAPSNSRSAIEWGLDMINADDVWNMGYMGQGVVVGGEDTGYEWSHPALKSKYRGYDADRDTVDHNYNWHDAIHEPNPAHADTINPCGYSTTAPCDDHGHGTHTMGTMIGLDGENQIGVAPEASWCACRNMERGWGTPFTYIECFEWFLAPTDINGQNPNPAKAPHVINNSWGCPEVEGCDSTNWEIMNMVVNNLRAAGIVVVVSAGNDGSGCGSVATPAAIFEGSFSVGATAPNDTIAGFSSRGPVFVDGSNRLKPNVSAPGVWVRSSTLGGNYGNSSGTSMAGPHVAGLVALIISANPLLAGKVDLIEDIIESTAVPKTTDQQCGEVPGSEVPNPVYGYGRIDALAAVEAALALVETGSDDLNNQIDALVFPNPVKDHVRVVLEDASAGGMIRLTDVQGVERLRQVIPAGTTINQVDLSTWPGGMYVLDIQSGQRHFSEKVVKLD